MAECARRRRPLSWMEVGPRQLSNKHTTLNGPNSLSIPSNGQDIYYKTIPINAQYLDLINSTMNY